MASKLQKYESMAPKWDSPVIIESHINGIRVKEMSPNLPITHEEISEEAIRCLDAGACAVHTHNTNYDLKGEAAFQDYKKSWDKVLEKYPQAIMYGTTCSVGLLEEDEHGLEHADILYQNYGGKLGVIDNGVINLGQGTDDDGYLFGVTHGYNFKRLKGQMEMCKRNGMGIIFSVFEPGFMRLALLYEKKGMLPEGSSLDLYLMGDYGLISMDPVNTGGVPATLESLYYYLYMMEGSKLPWFVSIWGAGSEAEIPLMRRTIELGGHLKVGLEMHYDPVHKPTNLDLLKQAQQIAKEVGRPIATPLQAKEIYGI